jgi:DNA invertase Pin-like site-specific DNA recombinase
MEHFIMTNDRIQNVGYKRISSADQNTARQLDGVELQRVFEDKISGKNITDRKGLAECVDYVRAGDVLHVHSMDRLARNLKDLLTLVEQLNTKGVTVYFHKENLKFEPDSVNPFNVMMLSVIGACAEFERNMIKERQKEGIAVALKSGVKFGASKKLNDQQAAEIKAELARGETVTSLSKHYGVSRQTIYRLGGVK